MTWSEVWALLIPLIFFLIYKQKDNTTRPIIYYIFIGLILNLLATLVIVFFFKLPEHLRNNTIFYNLHSIARVSFFSWYIITIRKYYRPQLYKILLAAYFVFLAFNFIFNDSITVYNNDLATAETITLLVLCIFFFLRSIQDDSEVNWLKHPAFLFCAGIFLYESVSFFINLFFYKMAEKNLSFGSLMLDIQNLIFLILCLMISMGLYSNRTKNE